MSLHEQARKLVDQAQAAIQGGNPQYATELLRQSILYNGKDADAYLLLGIALSQTGMPADAERAFLKATQLDPNSAKAHYNLAVQQYTEGQVRAALENARAASVLDSRHAASRDLAARIEEELGIGPGEMPKTTAAGNPTPSDYRPGYEPLPVTTMPAIAKMEPYWTLLGWLLAAASLSGLIVTLAIVLPSLGSNVNADALTQAWSHDKLMPVAKALGLGSSVLSLVWIALDAINRRANMLWLLPQAFCGCVGFTFVIVPLYMFLGRKTSES